MKPIPWHARPAVPSVGARLATWQAWLNEPGHTRALVVFLILVSAHFGEHVAQAIQVFALGWPRAQALGLLGLVWPWLVESEWLHFTDVLLTLAGLVLLRHGFHGEARRWWTAAIVVGVWHLFEHSLLLGQSLTGTTLFGAPVPTSVLQLVVPRIELHLVYNGIVLAAILMALAHQPGQTRHYHAREPSTAASA
jgi:hypothetical protein